jgi:hypothetical protein
MYFQGPLCAQLDEEALASLVAHEASHVCLLVEGKDWHDESAVDRLAESWGYRMADLPRVS